MESLREAKEKITRLILSKDILVILPFGYIIIIIEESQLIRANEVV